MSVDPRRQLITLMAHVPEEVAVGVKMKSVTERIGRISSILSKYPDMKNDHEVFEKIFKFTEKNESEKVRKFREDFILTMDCDNVRILFLYNISAREKVLIMSRCSADKTRRFLSNEELLSLSDQDFWDYLEKNKVKDLLIQSDNGEVIEYNKRVLENLLKKKPPIETLTEMYTLKFEDGEVKVSRAHLLLIGELFEDIITDPVHKNNGEFNFVSTTQNSIIPFLGLLNRVKMGESRLDGQVLENANHFFLNDKTKVILERAFGSKQWETLGINVTDIPPVPNVILDIENLEEYFIVLIPANVSINDFQMCVLNKLRLITATEEGILECYGENRTRTSYWVAIRTKMDDKSYGIGTGKEQLDYVEKNFWRHRVPSLLEAIACNVASYKERKESLFGSSDGSHQNYTCCQEELINGKPFIKFIVGGSSYSFAFRRAIRSSYVGVAPLLRRF